ncbi:hypothetical protein BaRGS_00020213 [Batillaria attramentaria]|uniref:Uncharacterized protein n=1 Tax=Batillaria attramentaria TaxID=370345 RepID=A0ABD0KNA3_9CAEN
MSAISASKERYEPVLKPPLVALLQALCTVVPLTLALMLLSSSSLFSSVTVELGLQHYAERRPAWLNWLPEQLPMPLNTAVNMGYILCGIYWCFFIAEANRMGFVKCREAFLFYVFNIMSCVYGFVQGYRIIVQSHASAVMDQWYTLPFFMLVFVTLRSFRKGWSTLPFVVLMFASVVSYSLTLLTNVGFEIALGCHILVAVTEAVLMLLRYPSEDSQLYFILGALSCAGFVGLKLLDLELPKFHWFFTYISGHFLSKISDILQIHFTNEFFFAMIFSVHVGEADFSSFKLKSG